MTLDGWITLATIVVLLVLLAREVVPPVAGIVGAVVVLVLARVLTPEQAFAGFSNRATITIAALFVVSRAVRATGGASMLVTRLLGEGTGHRRVIGRMVAPVAGLSGFFNNTPIVATLAPLVRSWAEEHGRSPSRFLMPLSFAAILGGLVTTIGTSTTLLVSGLVEQRGFEAFELFEVTRVGLPIALVGIVTIIVLAPRLVPVRTTPGDMLGAGGRQYTFRLRVEPFGPADGRSVADAGLRNLRGVYLARIDRQGQQIAPVSPDEVLLGGDHLVFVGQVGHVQDLRSKVGLSSTEEEHVDLLSDPRHRFYEVVVGATSPLAGRTLKEVGFRERYDAAVVAIHRAGERLEEKLGQARIHVGDVLLVLSDPGFGHRWGDSREFLLVAEHGDDHEVRPVRAWLVGAVVVAMIVAAGSGLLSILEAVLGAVFLLVAGRVLTVGQARDAVDLDVLLIIAGAFGLGAAVQTSGLAGEAADLLRTFGTEAGVVAALAVLLVVTGVLTELISNTAAAALMVPIALDVATRVGADPRGFAVAVAMMASASFLTPVGYQTNTMVYGLGGYRYRDYWRLGLPLTAIVIVTTVAIVPVAWPG